MDNLLGKIASGTCNPCHIDVVKLTDSICNWVHRSFIGTVKYYWSCSSFGVCPDQAADRKFNRAGDCHRQNWSDFILLIWEEFVDKLNGLHAARLVKDDSKVYINTFSKFFH